MPFKSINELPDTFADIPTKGKQIAMAAFNSAFSGTCKDQKDPEACAMKIAWSAIGNKFEKNKDGKWAEIQSAAKEYTAAEMKDMLSYMKSHPDMMSDDMRSMMEGMLEGDDEMMSSSEVISAKPIRKGHEIIVPFVKDNTIGTRRDGKQMVLTKEALQKHHKSWEGKRLSINHDQSNIGTIAETWYDDGFVYGRMTGLSDEVLSMINTPAYKGVSEEALPLEFDEKGNISKFEGLGNTLIFFPISPQCSPREGCGVVTPVSTGQIASAVPQEPEQPKGNCMCAFAKYYKDAFKHF